uniref:Uncharacterized protein n=1 Tax=Arundo donax TaxID=35708 RepID=A0A0A9D3V4_ARUDO
MLLDLHPCHTCSRPLSWIQSTALISYRLTPLMSVLPRYRWYS